MLLIINTIPKLMIAYNPETGYMEIEQSIYDPMTTEIRSDNHDIS